MTNSAYLETSIERGYTSQRLSRIRSDRKANLTANGKLRFDSVCSSADGDYMANNQGFDLMNERKITAVPTVYE